MQRESAPPQPKSPEVLAVEQRLREQAQQPINFGKFAFHSGSAILMVGAYARLKVFMASLPEPENNYGGDLQYLTILSMIVTVLTMSLSALNDVAPGDPVVISFKRLFMMIALPVEIVVSSIYWPLVIFSPHLMLLPKDLSDPASALMYIPMSCDLGIHLVPAVAVIVDFFLFEERYRPPASTRLAAALAFFVAAVYGFWIEYCANLNGRFPYPFLTIMELDHRMWTYMGAAAFAFTTFALLNAVHK